MRMRSLRRGLLVATLATGFTFGAATAHVDVAWAGDDSAATYAAAKKLFDAQSYAKALPLFQDAYAQSKSPNARVYVARCLRELGRLPEAYDESARSSSPWPTRPRGSRSR